MFSLIQNVDDLTNMPRWHEGLEPLKEVVLTERLLVRLMSREESDKLDDDSWEREFDTYHKAFELFSGPETYLVQTDAKPGAFTYPKLAMAFRGNAYLVISAGPTPTYITRKLVDHPGNSVIVECREKHAERWWEFFEAIHNEGYTATTEGAVVLITTHA